MQWVETAACVAPARKQVLFYAEMTDRYVLGMFGEAGEILEPEESAELKLTYWMPLDWLSTPDNVVVTRAWIEGFIEAIGAPPFGAAE